MRSPGSIGGGVIQLAKRNKKLKYDSSTGQFGGGRPKWPGGFAAVGANQTRHHKAPWAVLKKGLNDALGIKKKNRRNRRLKLLGKLAGAESHITPELLAELEKPPASRDPSFEPAITGVANKLFAIPGNVFVGPTDRDDDTHDDAFDAHVDESGYESDRSRKVYKPLTKHIKAGTLTNEKLKKLVTRQARYSNTVAPFNPKEWIKTAPPNYSKVKVTSAPRIKERRRTPGGGTHLLFK